MSIRRAVVLLLLVVSLSAGALGQDLRMERDRMNSILNVVAGDVQKNFYDPELKGLDWKALTAAAHEKINKANSAGEMITAIFSLVDKLQDSHTKFLPPARVNRPIFGFSAKPFGGDVRIFSVKSKSAAANAGLQVGDRILKVNGFDAERNSFDLMMLYFRRLRPASALSIVYQRGANPPQQVLVQAKIHKEPAVADLTREYNIWRYLFDYSSTRYDHGTMLEDGIGLIEVGGFDSEEVGLVHKLEKPAAVIVDLRGNSGGLESAVLELAGHFEPDATTMGERVERKKTEPLKIKPQRPNLDVPMVVLVDSHSASAAEMFARHFQRTGRAVVVGDHSSGRVNASRFFSEEIGTNRLVTFGVQISVGKVVFPGGEELENHGVTPDVQCLPTGQDLNEHRDPCLEKAVAVARQKLGLAPELPKATAEKVASFAARSWADAQKILDDQPD